MNCHYDQEISKSHNLYINVYFVAFVMHIAVRYKYEDDPISGAAVWYIVTHSVYSAM